MNTPTLFLSYPEAAMAYQVSTRTLSRLVATGTLTRHTSKRDHRRVLLNDAELREYFHGTPATHPTAA